MKKEKLTCATARSISIIGFLSDKGYDSIKENEKEAWYLSPLRKEDHASFKVSKLKNSWYDHGVGMGGNIIDLVVALNRNCSVQDALQILAQEMASFSFHRHDVLHANKEYIQITSVSSLKHPALIQYLLERYILPFAIYRYVSEVHYTFRGKSYFALGLSNISGGWELRNKYLKNSSSPKNYTLIQAVTPSDYNDSKSVIITEGMFDFFTIVMVLGGIPEYTDCIILNSLSFLEKVIEILPRYTACILYLDNDGAGRNAVSKIRSAGINFMDRSFDYHEYKDINEWAVKAHTH